MTTAIELLPASTDHASPWPPIGAPCCGNNAGLFREPVPPPSMLLGLRGMVVTYPTAMSPALRGLGQCPYGCPYGRPRMGCPCRMALSRSCDIAGCGCNGGSVMGFTCDVDARRTAMSGLGRLGGLPPATVAEANSILGSWAGRFGFTLPPTPLDVLDAAYRLTQTERQLELLRSKLRSTRAAGIPLTANDQNNYKAAADEWYAAARAVYDPIRRTIATVSTTAAALIPAVPRPPSIDEPDRALPYVPTAEEYAKVRAGDMTGLTGRFNNMVEEVRRRLSGRGMRGLGLFGIDDLGIGSLVLIIVGVISIAAAIIALVVGAVAVVRTINAWIVAKNAEEIARRRLEAYTACLGTGTGSTECSRQAQAIAEMPPPPPPAIDLGGVGGLGGGLVLGLAAAGAAFYFLGTAGGRARVGLTGMHQPRSRSRRRRY